MLRKLRPRSIYDVFAVLALVVAMGGTGAYAANTVFSSDIVDGEVKAADIGNNEIGSNDVKDNSINTFDVHSFLGVDVVDGTLTGADIADESIGAADIGEQQVGPVEVINDSLLQSDIRAGAVTGDEVLDNSLQDQDVGQGTFTAVDVTIGVVNAQSCKRLNINGINNLNDHLVLTPFFFNSDANLYYGMETVADSGRGIIKICNPTAGNIDDGNTTFQLLVIDAQ